LLVESLGYADMAVAEALLRDLVPDAVAGLPATAEDAVFALRGQAWVLAHQDRPDAAYAAARQAIDIGERHLGPQHKDTIRALGVLSAVYGLFDAHDDQMRTAADALVRARAAFGTRRPHPTLASIERRYGEALLANGRAAEAVPVLAQVLRDQRALDTVETERVRAAAQLLARAQEAAARH
jgi:hypothetical protein